MTVHFAHHPADTAPVLCGRWVAGGSCDRPVGHDGRCADSMAPALDPDRCPACGLRPTFVGERLCEACGAAAGKGGCGQCGYRHSHRISCAEVQHRADGPDHAQTWEPPTPRRPVTVADRFTDEWDWAS